VGALTVLLPFAVPQALVTICAKVAVTIQAVTTEPVVKLLPDKEPPQVSLLAVFSA
jgi:hypothetical protein